MIPLTVDYRASCTVRPFSDEELDRIVALKPTIEPEPPTTLGNVAGVRACKIRWLRFNERADARWIFERIADVVTDLNKRYFFALLFQTEPLQLTEYGPGEHYGMHADVGYGFDQTRRRKISISLQLSRPEDYEGGEMILTSGSSFETMPRERGAMLLFRSYITHQVRPVTAGVRDSLVTWVTGPEWK